MSAVAHVYETRSEALERARLATEALEAKERECARLQDQLVAERIRRGEMEQQIETADKAIYAAHSAFAAAVNEVNRAKILIAQPIRAGSGAGV